MTKEKQIEEMANAYYEAMLKARGTLGSMNEGAPKWYAKELYNAGYRKASDVAREVIEEAIEIARYGADEAKVRADKEANVLLRAELRGQQIAANLMLYALTELKKKYTEEGK